MTMGSWTTRVLLASAAFLIGGSEAVFYVPGVQPQNFQQGDEVPMKVNALTSGRFRVGRFLDLNRDQSRSFFSNKILLAKSISCWE